MRITFYDSGSTPEGTKLAMEQVVKNRPDIIIAEHHSAKAEIAANIAEKHKIVMLTTSATADSITKNRKYVFRIGYTNSELGNSLALFAINKIKASNAMVVHTSSDLYSNSLSKSWSGRFIANGGKILKTSEISEELESFKDTIDLIERYRPQVVFLPVYESLAIRFINAATLYGVKDVIYLSGDGWNPIRLQKSIISNSDSPQLYWASHMNSLKNNWLSLGYDSISTIRQLFKSVKSGSSSLRISNKLRRLQSFKGRTGIINFNNSQSPEKSIFIFSKTGSNMKFVKKVGK